MRVVAASVFLGGLLASAGALAGDSSCSVDNRLGLRLIQCDEVWTYCKKKDAPMAEMSRTRRGE